MPDENFKINLDIGLSPDAFANPKKAAQALDDVKESAQGVGNEIEETGKKVEKSGDAFDEAHKKGRLFREMLAQLGPEFQVVGEATHFLENPIVLAIGALLIGFAKFRESIEETDKKLDEMGAEAAKPVGTMLEAIAGAAEKAAASMRKFAEASKDSQTANAAINRDLEQQLALFKQVEELRDKLAKAHGAPEPTEEEKKARDLQAEIDQTKLALQKAQSAKAGLSITDLVAEKKTDDAKSANDEKSKAGLEEETKRRQADLDAAREKYEAELTTLQQVKANPNDRDLVFRSETLTKEAKGKMDEALAARDQAKEAERTNAEAAKRLAEKSKDLEGEIERRTAAEKELTASIAEYKNKIDFLQAQLDNEKTYGPAIKAADLAKTAGEVAQRLGSRQSFSQEDAQLIHSVLEQVMSYLENNIIPGDLRYTLTNIESRLKLLEQRAASNRVP